MDNFAIERVREYDAQIAIVLGSGLNSLVQEPARERIIPYSEIGGLPRSSVKGHLSRFVLGEIGGTRVVFAQGRVHLYEGYSAQEVTAGVRFLARAGIKRLILTNAAGSANPDFAPGSWMMITDHLNLTGNDAIVRREGVRRPDRCLFAEPGASVSPARRENLGLTLHQGIYASVLGPQYETPAEVKMLRQLGRGRDRDVDRVRDDPGASLGHGGGGLLLSDELGGRPALSSTKSRRSARHRSGGQTFAGLLSAVVGGQ